MSSMCRKHFVGLISTLLWTVALTASAAEITAEQHGAILNYSGRQRMLSQKMVKEGLQAVAGIDADASRQSLKETLALFRKIQQGLLDGDTVLNLPPCTEERVRVLLQGVSAQFGKVEGSLKKVAEGGKLEKAELGQLDMDARELLRQAELVVMNFQGRASRVLGGASALGTIIDVSGRQRMFTQKMSQNALFLHLGIAPDFHRSELGKTPPLFEKVLAGLANGDKDIGIPATSDQAILAQLGKIEKLWAPFGAVVRKAANSKEALSLQEVTAIVNTNLPLLKEANALVVMFEEAAKPPSAAPAAAADPAKAAPAKAPAKK